MKRARVGGKKTTELSVQEQLDLFQGKIKEEQLISDSHKYLVFFLSWVVLFWNRVKRATVPGAVGEKSWCKNSTIDQNNDSDEKKCVFVSCDIGPLLKLMESKNIHPPIPIHDLFYCPNHSVMHVCANCPFVGNLFGSSLDFKSISIPNEVKAVVSSYFPSSVNDIKNTHSIIFTFCKLSLVNINAQSDHEEYCLISQRKLPSGLFPERKREVVVKRINPKPSPKKQEEATPIKEIVSNLEQYVLISKKLIASIKESKTPSKTMDTILTTIKRNTSPTNIIGQLPAEILSSILPPNKKKLLDKKMCINTIKKIIHDFFYSTKRTERHNKLMDKRRTKVVRDYKQYISHKIHIEKVVPSFDQAFMFYCSILLLLPSQSPALELDMAFIKKTCEKIYRHWVIVCLSPYNLQGENNINLICVTISILFSMRVNGREWACDRVIYGNSYVREYLCSPSDIDHFGYDKKRLTEGNKMIEGVYESMTKFDIPIPTNLLVED